MKIQEMIARLQKLEARYGNTEMHFIYYGKDGMRHLRVEDIDGAVPPDENGNDGGTAPAEIYWDFFAMD